ncbi:MAG: hypothetical protein SVG88_07065 [Halobacteriales archaeon]|nr:hypothetical protein [Halobacteriales archaeon]
MSWRDRPRSFWLLILLVGQLAVRAFVGGTALVVVPSGRLIGLSTVPLDNTPFRTFFMPGLVLLLAFGVTPVVVCYGLYTNRWWAWPAVIIVALALLVWVIVEVAVGFARPTVFLNLGTAVGMLGVAMYPAVRHDLRARVA